MKRLFAALAELAAYSNTVAVIFFAITLMADRMPRRTGRARQSGMRMSAMRNCV